MRPFYRLRERPSNRKSQIENRKFEGVFYFTKGKYKPKKSGNVPLFKLLGLKFLSLFDEQEISGFFG